jgi:hypothetical protein
MAAAFAAHVALKTLMPDDFNLSALYVHFDQLYTSTSDLVG